jgi:hypothetical protein
MYVYMYIYMFMYNYVYIYASIIYLKVVNTFIKRKKYTITSIVYDFMIWFLIFIFYVFLFVFIDFFNNIISYK